MQNKMRNIPGMRQECPYRLVGREVRARLLLSHPLGRTRPCHPATSPAKALQHQSVSSQLKKQRLSSLRRSRSLLPPPPWEDPAAAHHHLSLLHQKGVPSRRGTQQCWACLCSSGQRFTPVLLQQETQKKPLILFTAEAGGIIIIIG